MVRAIRPSAASKEPTLDFLDINEERTEQWIKQIRSTIAPNTVGYYDSPRRFRAALLLCWWVQNTANKPVTRARQKYRYFYCTDKGLGFTNNPKRALQLDTPFNLETIPLQTNGGVQVKIRDRNETYDLESFIKRYGDE